jgi:hypothetical protein
MTKRKPGVALIVGANDERYLKRIYLIARKFNIKVFIIKREGE